MSKHLLSFELSEDNEELYIHGDEAGLKELVASLNKLINNTKPECFNHDHLMTPAWGGYELSEENKGGKVINHVKIYCWKDARRHKTTTIIHNEKPL